MQTQLKKLLLLPLAALLLSFPLMAQDDSEMSEDSTGLPGDNFSLEAALDLFKKSESLEDFEKLLNAENNDANNLDLNEDGQTDYIRVVDQMDGDVHAIVLQVPVSAGESQDIAVIEIEKNGTESAELQIVGDEDIFGSEVIAEPFDEEGVKKDGRGGPSIAMAPVRVVVNVWLWRPVRFIYRPAYVVYVSPWRWGLYPTYWRPFRPRPWHVYHVRARPYRVHYHVVATHRVVRAHAVYAPHRSHSTVVHTRTVTHVSKTGPRGNVKATKTTKTTKVEGPRGRKAEKTTKTTKVEGPRGGKVTKRESSTKVKGNRGKRH